MIGIVVGSVIVPRSCVQRRVKLLNRIEQRSLAATLLGPNPLDLDGSGLGEQADEISAQLGFDRARLDRL